jgi:hypothetical protein
MASLGIPEENIRFLVRNRSDTPISRNSLRKHFKKELEIGATKLNSRVGHFMVATIFGTRPPDGVTPIRDERVRGRLGELFLKARLGWREVVLNQHEVPKQSKEQRVKDAGAVRRRLEERLRRFALGAVAMCVGICWRGLRWDEDTGSGSQVNRLFSKVLV